MKKSKVVYFAVVILLPFYSWCQSKQVNNKNDALAAIRTFRTTLNSRQLSNYKINDSIKTNVSLLLNITKTVSDSKQLDYISDYFISWNEILSSSIISDDNPNERQDLLQSLNSDIKYKIYSPGNSTLSLEESFSFGTRKNIKINAIVDGKPTTQNSFRLYWALYTGRPVEKVHTKMANSTDGLSSPYSMNLLVPGYFTFWLIEVSGNKVYKSDFDFKKLSRDTEVLDIYFKKI